MILENIFQHLAMRQICGGYRNVFLCNAMVNLYMIDTNSMGIPMMYQIQRDKCFPLPTYDLNMGTVFLLDQVQKQETISKENFKELKKQGLVEGRYPNIFETGIDGSSGKGIAGGTQ